MTLATLVALVVFLVPGAVAAFVLGFRRFSVLGLAAPLSLAGLALLSVVEVFVPLPWTPVTWLVSALTVVGVAAVVRRIVRGSKTTGPIIRNKSLFATIMPFVAVMIPATAITVRLLAVFGGADHISQTFDNIYHLNAVRYILDTGQIAPTHQIIPGFYPSLWHAVTATVSMLSGASIPVAVNATSLVLAAVVWPASIVFLTRQIVGSNSVAVLSAGVLSAGMAGFPLLMLDHGVLYPNVLSISLLPAALAFLLQVAGVGDGDRPPALTRWLLLLSSLAVLGLAHPSTLMAFFAIGIWPAFSGGVRWFVDARRRPNGRRQLLWGLVVWAGGLAATAGLLIVARPTVAQAFWPPSLSLPDAVMQVLSNSVAWKPVSVSVTIVMFLGIIGILLLRRRWWWLVAGWATIAIIYVVCASFPMGVLRYGLTGTWYSDLFRIAALLPAVVVPLGAVGIMFVVATASQMLRVRRTRVVTAAGVVVAIVLLLATQMGAQLREETSTAHTVYALNGSSPLLTEAESALLYRLPEHVAAGEVIAGSPWTGTALSYALADRPALIPHIYQEATSDVDLLSDRLNRASEDPAVCDAVERTGTRWVLDFGTHEVHGAQHPYPGFTSLDEAAGFELVDAEGRDARLYRITACG